MKNKEMKYVKLWESFNESERLGDKTWFVTQSIDFDRVDYDVNTIKNALIEYTPVNSEDITIENDRGWENQPEVVVFSYKTSIEDERQDIYEIEAILADILNINTCIIKEKDW